MLLSHIVRQSILKFQKTSDKKHLPALLSLTQSMTTGTHICFLESDSESNLNGINRLATKTPHEHSFFGRLLDCKPCKAIVENQRLKVELDKRSWEDSEANLYWKYKAKEYYAKTQEADKVQEKLDCLTNSVTNIQKDMDVQRKSVRQINDRVVSLEKLMVDSHILLEKIRSAIHQEDRSLPECRKFIHMLSRESPYIYTNRARFPVTERHIHWEVPFDLYDPAIITLPKQHECFQDIERLFVEPNMLKSSFDSDDESQLAAEATVITPTSLFQPDLFGAVGPQVTTVTNDFTIPFTDNKWNQTIEMQLSDGRKIILDRTTWTVGAGDDKTSSTYRLDNQLAVPLNPMGRTGIRGRGALIRWGPNKSIMAVVTRWKSHRGQFAVVDGQRILEALVFKDKLTNDWKLPGGKILGVESPYGAVCRSFNKLAFKDNDSEHSLSLEENDMIEHFESFARSSTGTLGPTGFESHMIYRGYIDDIRNTDNAWTEAEIWNFHYGSSIVFPNLRTDGMSLWKDVTNNTRGFLIQTSILREIARIHDAYFE
ncbi:unnamed protein product [Rotaria socialis]|nr:unnamed protein product [Rotaria socialis]CAF4717362.1 unnamed protein product [Rotaria socialis]